MQRSVLLALFVSLLAGCGDDAIGTGDDAYLRQVSPCDAGSCWGTDVSLRPCGFAVVEENFSSGAYNVHRHEVRLGEGQNRISLTNYAGDWEPAIVVAEAGGRTVFDGSSGNDAVVMHLRSVSSASVTLDADEPTDVVLFITRRATISSGFSERMPTDARYGLVVDNSCDTDPGIDMLAPDDALDDEPAYPGESHIDPGRALRFNVPAGTHVAFELASSGEMEVLHWTGDAVQEMAVTTGGRMAVLDHEADHTYWVRSPSSNVVVAKFLPFREGTRCEDDCDRLMQLPLPNDPRREGYDMVSDVVYRYQFGRREVVQHVRHAGRAMVAQHVEPFTIEDLSKESGSQPPGHASHTEGKDIDISVYDPDGNPTWAPQCNERNDNCIAGTDFGMDVESMARKISALLDGERVTHVFLDREFHNRLYDAASALLPESRVTYMKSVVQHWPNHNNHIHVRYRTD